MTLDPVPAPRGAAGTQDRPLCPHAGGIHLPKPHLALEPAGGCPTAVPHFPAPPAQHPPSTPSLDPASPLLPKMKGTARLPHLTPSPLPSPGTAPCEQQVQLGCCARLALGRLRELPGSGAWLLLPLFIRQVGFRTGSREGVWGRRLCTHTLTLTLMLTLTPCPVGDKCRRSCWRGQ